MNEIALIITALLFLLIGFFVGKKYASIQSSSLSATDEERIKNAEADRLRLENQYRENLSDIDSLRNEKEKLLVELTQKNSELIF